MLRTISNTISQEDKAVGAKRSRGGERQKKGNGKKARVFRSKLSRPGASSTPSREAGRRSAQPPTEEELLAAYTPTPLKLEYGVDREAVENGKEIEFIHYKHDLLKAWKTLEKESGNDGDFMETVQSDLKPRMLAVLYGWMIEVNAKFKLHEETLWQSMSLCNRYLSIVDVPRVELQLVGSVCLWISAKYTEIYPPLAKDFVYISDNAYSREQLLAREQLVCAELGYNFTGPTPYTFAVRYADVATHGFSEKNRLRVKCLTLYGLERAALTYELYKHSQSALAAAALHCALSCTGHRWTTQVGKLTSFTAKEIKPLSREVRTLVLLFDCRKHKAVIQKYKAKELGAVANLRIKGGSRHC